MSPLHASWRRINSRLPVFTYFRINPMSSHSRRHRASRLPISSCFAFIAATFLASIGSAQVTIGDALIAGSDDNSSGGVYIYTNTFGQAGTATSWSFFDNDNDGNNRSVTPLLFQKLSSTIFQLTGVGTTVTTNEGGSQTGNAFGLIAGSASVGSDYTFGFVDRAVSYSGSGTSITTGSSNTGVVDFQSSGGVWAFVPSAEGTFDLIMGQNFEIGAATDSDDSTVALYGTFNRQYSAQFTTSAVPEPATAGILVGLLALGAVGCRRRRRPASS